MSDDEINETIEKSFGYLRVPPTPAPSPTPDPAATPSTEPTATPAPSPTPVSLEAYEKAKKDYMSRLDTATGMSEADFRKIVELDLLRQKLYDDVTKDVPANWRTGPRPPHPGGRPHAGTARRTDARGRPDT